MTKYIAFLRAINVGGTKIIKMEHLRKLFEAFGLSNVQTYIQTGNVIFETKAKNTPLFESKLENQLEEALGFRVEVLVRSMDELAAIVTQDHFEPQPEDTLHVVFLREKPSKAQVAILKKYNSPADKFAVSSCEVYNLRRDRDTSVFSNNFIEKVFGIATTRNMTTLKKIFEKYQ